MTADVPGNSAEPTSDLQNVALWEVLWSLESEASTLRTTADNLIRADDRTSDDRPSWHERERADWRAAYDRPHADWRELYEATSPPPASAPPTPEPEPEPEPEVIELAKRPPSIDLPRIVAPVEEPPSRRPRPAAFASQIKEDAPPDSPGMQHTGVTGSFRNVVYGIDTETPAARLKDLLNQRAFDQLWTAGSNVDGDQFVEFFAEEGFGTSGA